MIYLLTSSFIRSYAMQLVDLSHVISPSSAVPEDSYGEQYNTGNNGATDDWGFHSEDDSLAVNSDGRSDASMPTGSAYTSTTSGKHIPTELPAEDVAFWGEELAEQMYFNTVSPPLAATKSMSAPSAIVSAPLTPSETEGVQSIDQSRSDSGPSDDICVPIKAKKSKSPDVRTNIVETKKEEGETKKRIAGVVKVTKTLLGRGLRRKTR